MVVKRSVSQLAYLHLHKIKHKKTKAASDEGGSVIQNKKGYRLSYFFSPIELTGKINSSSQSTLYWMGQGESQSQLHLRFKKNWEEVEK